MWHNRRMQTLQLTKLEAEVALEAISFHLETLTISEPDDWNDEKQAALESVEAKLKNSSETTS